MNPITFPLRLGDKGTEIVNLQNGLLFLLRQQWFQLNPREREQLETALLKEQQRQFFSDNATYELVKRFQERVRIQPSEEGIDQPTAEAFNTVLKELNAFPDRADEIPPETNRKLDAIVGSTRKLNSIDNQLIQQTGQLGKIEGNLSNQNNQLGRIDSQLGEQTTQLGRIDSKLGDLNVDRATRRFLILNDRGTEVKELQGNLSRLNLTIPQNELDEQVFGVGTREALMQLQSQYQLERTGILDAETQIALERAIAALSVTTHRLEGRIFFDRGLPAAGVTLKLYHRGFGRTEAFLGEVTTDAQGFYALSYPVNGKTTNLEVRAVDAEGKEIALSDTKRQAGKNEVFNLVAPSRIQPLAAEYQRLTSDLSQQLGDLQQLAGAQENDERQDLTLLHQETGWDARLIALAASAVRLGAETGIPQDALYALFRVGLPTDKEQLARVSGEAVEKALAQARESNIASLTARQVAGAIAAFASFARQSRRAAIAPGTVSSMGDLLDNSGLADSEKTIFEDLYLTYPGAELWQKAEESGLSAEQVSTLQLQGKLAYLTLNNAALVNSLQQELQSLDNLNQLVNQDLYRVDAWEARLEALAGDDETLIPPIYEGEDIGDRRKAYAADLARKVRLSFPTQVIRRAIEKDELQLGTRHRALKAPVLAFLQNAETLGFELGRTPLATFIQQQSQAVLNGIDSGQVPIAIEGTKLLQRLYQITPTNESLGVLMEQGFTSARSVVAFPYETFLERFGQKFSSPEEAKLVYRKAEQVTAITFNVYSAVKQLDSAPSTHVTSPSAVVREAAKNELIKHYPTMEKLFGSLDFCECEHCRSVLSPAAYFVDLLDFLDYKVDLTHDDDLSKHGNADIKVWEDFLENWKETHGSAAYPFKNQTEQANFLDDWRSKHPGQPDPNTEKTPYEVLLERRPDLPHLPLTCENTHTGLPYIDLVNEILEYYVAHEELTADSVRDTGSATTPELLAEPQNILAEAYTKLQAANYPLALPFDLWLETVRQFFEHFETPLARVLEVLRPTDELFPPAARAKPYYRSAIWAESLGLSPAEFSIFTNFDPIKWYELYGYAGEAEALTEAWDENGQRVDLNSAKALSRRLGVSYQEVVELVQTGFVNPQLEKLVVLRKLGVEVDDVFRYQSRRGQTVYPPFTPDERAAFQARLQALTAKFPGFDAETWLDTAWNNGAFNQILLLVDPNAGCNFDLTTLRYADGTAADGLVFLKLNLFVRLWRKLGWTIAETDRALQVFIPQTLLPLTGINLSPAFKTALVYLAHLKEISDRLNVGKDSRLKLLTFWSNLSTTGRNPLYAQLFLKQSILKNDPVFEHPLGHYLQYFDARTNRSLPFQWDSARPEDPTAGNVSLKSHLLSLQGALGLTAEDIALILPVAGQTAETAALNLETISLLYRYGLLAKALKLSIRELIALKELSGLDPFKPLKEEELTALEEDYPFTQTLQFIETVENVKQSGFKIEDLDYLLRHRFDPVGQYRVDSDTVLGSVKTLAAEIRRIQAEHAIPDDATSLTDEGLRQKLALILPSEVVETFLGMWTGAIEYAVSQDNVLPADKLDPKTISNPAIRVAYDDVRQVQQLTFRGVLLEGQKTELTTANPSPLFANLLNAVQEQAQAFFDKYFVSFLKEPDDFNLLFTPIPDELTDGEKQERMREKQEKLIRAFFPFLQSELIRQFIVQTLATTLNADIAPIEALLTDATLLADPTPPANRTQPDPPLLDAFAASGETGVSAFFFPSTDGTDTPTTQRIPAADTTAKPADSNSASLTGYFEVPTAGAYRFFVAFDKQDAEAELRLAHLPNPLLRGKAERDRAEITHEGFVELKAGIPYQFALDVRNLGGGDARLLIRGETLPKDSLRQLTLYPQAAVDRVDRAYTRLTKTLQLIEGFALNEREVRYLLARAADFANLNFNQLPTRTAEATPTNSTALFQQILRLANYAHLKGDLAGDTDDLIDLFENARRVYSDAENEEQAKNTHLDELYQRIADLTRRDKAMIEAVAQHLGFAARATLIEDQWEVDAPDFARDLGLGRLWDILQVVEKLGVPVDAIARWTGIVNPTQTHSERFKIARDLRNAVNAKYEAETWQKIAQPIFDKLRQRQRDALVAYIMPRRGFARLEQLFEYFLIDPGMEPVVQTSRIRLAISSVQLFIQRCLLNLEPQVRPSAINSKHWQWMKRYRVWEANRKIFLYPENWLEPEFRDDKTDLFQELEGALLQSDISNDSAEDAFFNYLKKLEELARLEMVTLYVEEKPLDPASNTLHVIGRTHSIPHKYFYRRYAHQMWTPWEPVTAEIEGDHIAAVVWRDRLHLFWVTFLEKANANPDGVDNTNSDDVGRRRSANKTLEESTFNDIVKASNQSLQKEVEVQLNWSEYFQGKWTTRESGGFDKPLRVSVGANFDRRQVLIHVTKEFEEGEERAVIINLSGSNFENVARRRSGANVNFTAFRVVSKNSLPTIYQTASPQEVPYSKNGLEATQYTSSNSLQVSFVERIDPLKGQRAIQLKTTQEILQQEGHFSLLMPSNPTQYPTAELAPLVSPFFYQDSQHTFFVEPNLTETTIERWRTWAIRQPKPKSILDGDWQKRIPVESRAPYELIPSNPLDPLAKFSLQPGRDWLVNPATVLQFERTLIGQKGRFDPTVQSEIANVIGGIRGTTSNANINLDFSLNIVDSNGLNSALLDNVNASLNAESINSRISLLRN